jgi:prepilin-type N-terminal cleavage/methylation domain-containing protein
MHMAKRSNKRIFPRNSAFWQAKKGFSLVEIMVTVAVLGVVIIGLLKSFIYFSAHANTAEHLTLAMSKAQTKLEEMRGHNFDNILADYGPSGTPGNVFFLTRANDGIDGSGVIYLTSLNSGLLQVEIVVCWRNKDGRFIGEDNGGNNPAKALNGILDTAEGEDVDGNVKLSSGATIISMIAKR